MLVVSLKVFDTTDTEYPHNDKFLGTELVLRKDLWDKGTTPCPQDAPVFGINIAGVD